ncbi:MAG: hypothetical protein ABII72_02100 [Parcubacteria group bacterium]
MEESRTLIERGKLVAVETVKRQYCFEDGCDVEEVEKKVLIRDDEIFNRMSWDLSNVEMALDQREAFKHSNEILDILRKNDIKISAGTLKKINKRFPFSELGDFWERLNPEETIDYDDFKSAIPFSIVYSEFGKPESDRIINFPDDFNIGSHVKYKFYGQSQTPKVEIPANQVLSLCHNRSISPESAHDLITDIVSLSNTEETFERARQIINLIEKIPEASDITEALYILKLANSKYLSDRDNKTNPYSDMMRILSGIVDSDKIQLLEDVREMLENYRLAECLESMEGYFKHHQRFAPELFTDYIDYIKHGLSRSELTAARNREGWEDYTVVEDSSTRFKACLDDSGRFTEIEFNPYGEREREKVEDFEKFGEIYRTVDLGQLYLFWRDSELPRGIAQGDEDTDAEPNSLITFWSDAPLIFTGRDRDQAIFSTKPSQWKEKPEYLWKGKMRFATKDYNIQSENPDHYDSYQASLDEFYIGDRITSDKVYSPKVSSELKKDSKKWLNWLDNLGDKDNKERVVELFKKVIAAEFGKYHANSMTVEDFSNWGQDLLNKFPDFLKWMNDLSAFEDYDVVQLNSPTSYHNSPSIKWEKTEHRY